MNIEIPIETLTQLLALAANKKTEPSQAIGADYLESPWELGRNYLIRTVTMIQTGRLIGIHPTELVLTDAAWVADAGRFADALKSCEFNEVEPFPNKIVIVGRSSIIDATTIDKIPTSQK